VIGIIQTLLMMFVFKYDTPQTLKQRADYDKLTAMMSKVYDKEQVQMRMDELSGNTTGHQDEDPTNATLKVAQAGYSETFCNP